MLPELVLAFLFENDSWVADRLTNIRRPTVSGGLLLIYGVGFAGFASLLEDCTKHQLYLTRQSKGAARGQCDQQRCAAGLRSVITRPCRY